MFDWIRVFYETQSLMIAWRHDVNSVLSKECNRTQLIKFPPNFLSELDTSSQSNRENQTHDIEQLICKFIVHMCNVHFFNWLH